jgi:hypothetical protein
MILLNNDFGSLPDLRQDAVDIASEFGFGNAKRRHIHDHSGIPPLLPFSISLKASAPGS